MDLAAIVGRVRHALTSRSFAGADARLKFELNGVGGPVHDEVTRDSTLDRGSSSDPGAPGSLRRPGMEQHQWCVGHALHPQTQEQTTCRGPSPAPGRSFLPGPRLRLASLAAQSRADPCGRRGSRANLCRLRRYGSLDRQARWIERWSLASVHGQADYARAGARVSPGVGASSTVPDRLSRVSRISARTAAALAQCSAALLKSPRFSACLAFDAWAERRCSSDDRLRPATAAIPAGQECSPNRNWHEHAGRHSLRPSPA
jgi:hypothetical protein